MKTRSLQAATFELLAPTLLAAMLSGCTYQEYVLIDVEPVERALALLSDGDDIRLTTIDGSQIDTSFESIEGGMVVGKNERVPVENVATVSIIGQEVDQTDEVARVIGVYALLGYLLTLAF
jgi:hypothetical protein